VFIGLAVALVVAPFVAYPVFVMKVLCFALFACAFNLLLGYGGLLSFGHAAYFGMASYVSAYTAKHWGLTPELAILLGTAVSALLGLAFGSLAIRRQGIYFAMITLALAQMAFFFSLQTPRFTGGEDGIQAVPRGHLFGVVNLSDDRGALLLGGCDLLCRAAAHLSDHPLALRPGAEGDPGQRTRAISLGYRTHQYKLAVFVLSASLAGVRGRHEGDRVPARLPHRCPLVDVGEVVLMTLVGGMGTVFGPIVGALVVVSMQNYLASFGSWVLVIQGVIFVICVLLFREGIVGVIAKRIGRPL
jgi:branched-chain amino acid transport system permease protein